MTKTSAAIFDVFGTVVDWRSSVAGLIDTNFANKGIAIAGEEIADHWRSLYVPSMAEIRSGKRTYVPLDVLHIENLDKTLSHFGISELFSTDERMKMSKYWEQLSPWQDSVEGLCALKTHTIIAPCSNGSISLMARLAKFADLPWDSILGAEIAGNYKPDPSVYLASCEALQLDPRHVLMVAAHNDDLHAARKVGLQTAFVHRPTEYGPNQTKDLEPNGNWDLVLDSLADPKLVAHFS